MAKKKSYKTRYITKKAGKSYKKKKSGMTGLLTEAMASMAYGATRQYASNWLAPFTSKIPLGGIADEAGLAAAALAVRRYVPNKFIKNIATTAFRLEMARIGESLTDTFQAPGTTNTGSGIPVV